ncbi:hypothetical protein F8B43_1897 [Methylorubrum populi]|uniref:Uncharacterized protein n=1 Tax=Methylorubrum populi TaxID=223967 RepID=A0A833MZI0_9HYPH|nr:hypothetical protein F8B43_1897 [Methylorubrum populi]
MILGRATIIQRRRGAFIRGSGVGSRSGSSGKFDNENFNDRNSTSAH